MMARVSLRIPRVQFSLRLLLMSLTGACLWLGFTVSSARRQREAVDAVKRLGLNRLGSEVVYDYQLDSRERYNSAARLPAPQVVCDTIGIDYFARVVGVTLAAPRCSGALIKLRRLRRLPRLSIIFAILSSEDIDSISAIQGIERLQLIGTQNTGGLLQRLGSWSSLRRVDIGWCDISDSELRNLAKCERLAELTIYVAPGTLNISDSTIEELRQALPMCEVALVRKLMDSL